MPNAASIARDAQSNPFLKAALDSLPEYQTAVDLRAAATKAQGALRAVPIAAVPTTAAGIPDYLERVAQQMQDSRLLDTQRGALASLVALADNQIESLLTTEHRTLLAALNDDLDALMADVDATVFDLAGATNAGKAIEYGVEKAWRQLPDLRVKYDLLRAAQTAVVNAGFDPYLIVSAKSPSLDDPIANDMALRNLDDVLPGWRQPDNRRSLSMAPLADRRPWPDDPLEQLVWLSASIAKPWIPTARELFALQAQRRDVGQPPFNPDDVNTVRPHERKAPNFTAVTN